MWWGRLAGLMTKEFMQVLRDPVILFLVFFPYSAELVICTLALGFDVQNLKLGVIDHDRTEASRTVIQELTAGDNFVLADQFADMRQVEDRLQRGALDAVVEIPPGLARRVAAGRGDDHEHLAAGAAGELLRAVPAAVFVGNHRSDRNYAGLVAGRLAGQSAAPLCGHRVGVVSQGSMDWRTLASCRGADRDPRGDVRRRLGPLQAPMVNRPAIFLRRKGALRAALDPIEVTSLGTNFDLPRRLF